MSFKHVDSRAWYIGRKLILIEGIFGAHQELYRAVGGGAGECLGWLSCLSVCLPFRSSQSPGIKLSGSLLCGVSVSPYAPHPTLMLSISLSNTKLKKQKTLHGQSSLPRISGKLESTAALILGQDFVAVPPWVKLISSNTNCRS